MALIPVFQASKLITGTWSGVDYDYPVGTDAARASADAGYTIGGVAFVAEDAPQTGYVAFARYSCNGFHFFTTDTQGERLQGWTRDPATTTAYLATITSTPATGMVALQRYLSTGQTGVAHFFCSDPSVTPIPSGWTEEDPSHTHTGWVFAPTRAELQVTYNGNGDKSGISVTGGNAVGTVVTLPGGTSYTMKADDVLIPYGIGNWIRFNKGDSNAWHFTTASVAPAPGTPSNDATFGVLLLSEDTQVALIDADEDNSQTDYAYNYSFSIFDENLDKTITYDPKIINRSPRV